MTSPVDNNNPVDETVPTEQTTNPPPASPVEEDENAIKINFLNQAAREIFDRIDPDEIAYLIKVDPSGKGSGGNNPFDVFNKVSGGNGGTPGVGG